MPNNFQTREEWLGFVTDKLRPTFVAHGTPLPKVRFSVGFTSGGYRGKTIGECWDSKASVDKHCEIFIKPTEDQPLRVAGILAHELAHAAVGVVEGHKRKWSQCMLALGMEGGGKRGGGLKHSCEGAGFTNLVTPILKQAGPLPHKSLNAFKAKKKQSTRLLKCECPTCGYVARVAKKWVDLGTPICGHIKQHGHMACEDTGDDDEGEE